jgi:polysaccharide export outer membrane protein
MKHFFQVISLLMLLASCVPNRNYVYLQKDDVKKKDVPLDTLVRTYKLNIEEYRIQPLDILSIKFESLTADDYDFISKLYPNTNQGVGGGTGSSAGGQVQTGFIVDPTLFEAQEKLKEVFAPFLDNPIARVNMLNFRFTVLGEVTVERVYTSTNTRITLIEAIGLAGGLREMADKRKVKVIRQQGNTSSVLYFNLLDEEVLMTNNYYVHQNDVIIVPPLKQRPFREYWTENISIFVSTVSVVLLVVNLIVTDL